MPETRILLVEDDPDVRNILSIILEGEGYTVDTARTVDEAMRRLDGMRYSLVATDWRLPDGLGATVADRAAELGAKTVIISGYLFSIPPEIAERHELLMKPMRPSEFVFAVKHQLGAPAG
jgi:two-component system response regulator PilR (NtrC family)